MNLKNFFLATACMLLALLVGCSGAGKFEDADSGTFTPVWDSGKKKFDGGGPPKKDSQAGKKDKGNPNKALCDCLAKQPKMAYCYKQRVTCSKASDCCYALGGITCGTWGNKFSCKAGKCVREGCSNKAECVAYATKYKQKDPQSWSCKPPVCPGFTNYCAAKVKTCSKASDCCDSSSKSPCGVYPNHWVCKAGKCKTNGCVTDGECQQYAKLAGVPNYAGYTCKAGAPSCYTSVKYCYPPGTKTCSKASDCCLSSSTIPCGTYGNRYRCVSGACVADYCKGKQDCFNYAKSAKLPDPGEYNCVVF